MLIFEYYWIFILLPAPIVVLLFPPRARQRPAVRVPFLSRLLQSRDMAGSSLPNFSFAYLGLLAKLAVWTLVVVALARPQWLDPPIERTIPARDLLMLVDLSGSMEHEDFSNQAGEAVNRLEAVKEVMGEFLARREGDRVGLVVFGNSPFLQVPFTTDLELCRQLLDETQVGMAGPRTALGDAIGLGIQLFDSSEVPTKTIIALTDGNDTASAVPPVEASRIARDREITIHTIAIGDPTSVGEQEIDQEALREVASVTNGSFFLALDRSELAEIYSQLEAIETREVNTVSHRPRRDLYFWPLAGALAISVLSTAWQLISHRRLQTDAPSSRLQVNSRTFEIESVQLANAVSTPNHAHSAESQASGANVVEGKR
ncbi:MAG: VWA domain-containing protein [Aureliella sp.]